MNPALSVPLTDRPGKWLPADGHGCSSTVYATAGNANAAQAHAEGADYARSMTAAITSWNAAIARGFVCC